MKKEPRLLKVGVLGCGPIAQIAHFDSCCKARNVELYAICDVADDLLARMAAIHEPRITYHDYDLMLADPAVEAVIIATADAFHVEAAGKAIEAGKHVLVEKPLGVTIEECEQLAAKVRRRGVTLQVGNMKRFDPGIAYAKKFLEEEAGEKIALKAWYCDSIYRYTVTDNIQPVPLVSNQARRPKRDPKENRRAYLLLAHASHLVDTARFLGGEIVAVQARLTEKFGAYCWMVTAEFAGGFFGQLNLGIPLRMDWHEGFEVHAEHGSVVGKTFNPWYLRSSEVECCFAKDGTYRRVVGADAHFYKLQLESLSETILTGAPQRGASVEDGVAALRALVAIAQSCRSGQSVRLAEVTGGIE